MSKWQKYFVYTIGYEDQPRLRLIWERYFDNTKQAMEWVLHNKCSQFGFAVLDLKGDFTPERHRCRDNFRRITFNTFSLITLSKEIDEAQKWCKLLGLDAPTPGRSDEK